MLHVSHKFSYISAQILNVFVDYDSTMYRAICHPIYAMDVFQLFRFPVCLYLIYTSGSES